MSLGMRDIRPESPTCGLAVIIELDSDTLQAVAIPPGVAHGFYFPRPSTHLYAVSEYWNMADELGCRWNDPALGLDWKSSAHPLLSERDEAAGSMDEMVSTYVLRGGRHGPA